ncbi:MAG TPA: NADH-quinone oxidoreductase subunit C [Pyrinomonadaceae bacterium]|jgi:NADH-quinone oxidoreductase subunit C|nr:NADH-quinone oxidoreductase subunit C [Pyrinomonadaceae bacterium]
MSEDTRQPDTDASNEGDVSAQPEAAEGKPTLSSDTEKNTQVEDAKARVIAAKEALTEKAAAATTPKPPVKKKEEGPKPTDASGHPLVLKLKQALGDAVPEASEFLGQLSVRIDRAQIVKACTLLRDDPKTPFNYLSDVTCVHYPEQVEAPFDVVYNLYSIPANERVRLNVAVNAEEGVDSVCSVWPAANWMEREVYDLFGVQFLNHPDLRRLLLPPDWVGYPLRKDYPLEFVENLWTEQHLPEMTDVQREQLEQRRTYGLDMLSVPQERLMREIFQGGKEVMPKDK